MSGKDSKRSKGRRTLSSSHSKSSAAAHTTGHSGVPVSPNNGTIGVGAVGGATASPFQPFGSKLTMNVCDVATEFGLNLKPSVDEEEEVQKMAEVIDAPIDLNIPPHTISRGQNPYLEQCMYCSTPRSEAQDGDEGLELLDLQLDGNAVISGPADPQSFRSLKLEIWTCDKCRKVAGNFQNFLLQQEANLPQPAYELPPFLRDREHCVDAMSCFKCQEELSNHERETQELQENWVELRSVVKDIYTCEEEPSLSEEQGERLKYLVDKLCSRDPHQLFLRLESQVREIVMGIKKSLLNQLNEYPQGCPSTPQQALSFTSSLLKHHDLLTKKAHLLAVFLGGMSEHLKRFKVTWELLNKHLFHSIVHTDSSISNCGPTILEQLRQGSVMQEKSKDDPYCVVRKELLKFQNEMAVVVVVWRDCQQLIENYCQEEVKNTQKQVQILKEHLIKEPLMDEALSETMRNLISGHKSSAEKVMCHRCKRERCTCDECTITHMITCGNMSTGDKAGDLPHMPNSFNFALDHTRNMVMDITPPSMSSTTSSSGSVSPINIEDNKLTTFYDCEKEEFSEALMNHGLGDGKAASTDDIDENAGDDEDDEDDEEEAYDFPDNQDVDCDEPHALQVPIIELKDADAALWEAVQQHHQQQQLLQQQQQHVFQQEMSTEHNCAQCHQGQQCVFQPRLDPELSRQLDEELAKNGLLPSGAGDCNVEENLPTLENSAGEAQGSGDGVGNPGLCATCQCHACLKQSGQIISTNLPLQVPVSPPPAELHLYPHIHGLPQQHPQRYMTFDLPSALMPPIKLPVKLDFNDPAGSQDHIYHAYSDWDNTLHARPGSLAAQHQHQHQQRLSALTSDLLPPAPLTSNGIPFSLDTLSLASHLATHTTQTSTTNTASAFKSVAGKHNAASVLPSLTSLGGTIFTSEGSSVDPTKVLDFSSLSKLPISCLNSTGQPPSFSGSSPSGISLSSSSSSPSTVPVNSKSSGTCHGPPCSRPNPVGGNASASSKWEKSHPQHCKKLAASGGVPGFMGKGVPTSSGAAGVGAQSAGHMVHPFTGSTQGTPSPLPPQAALKNLLPAAAGSGNHCREDVFKSFRSTLPCSHASNPSAIRNNGLSAGSAPPHSGPPPSVPSPLPCSNGSNNLPSVVNNIGVGTSVSCSGEHGFEGHHPDDNCDSVDDSCSEKSSTTSNNQKEGKYCDCCYCEFFGHNNTQVAKTSTNYAQMKDRLQKKLKKRQTEKHKGPSAPKNGLVQSVGEEKDPLEKKGLEGLLSFINGTEGDDDGGGQQAKEAKELTAKAAKRARQKQRKLEEKARQEKSKSPSEKPSNPPDNGKLHHFLLKQALNLTSPENLDPNMVKPKLRKVRPSEEMKNNGVLPEVNTSCSQEITRSSLIIESTRPTISKSAKDIDKGAVTSQPNNGLNNQKASQQMIEFLKNITQQQHQQNVQKSAPSSISTPLPTTKPTVSVAKGSCELKSSAVSKSSASSTRESKETVSASKNQKVAQQLPLPSNKVVNGKVPVSVSQANHTKATNGKGVTAEKRSQSSQPPTQQQQHPVSNGSVKSIGSSAAKGQKVTSANTPVSTAPPVASAPPVLPSKICEGDSPSAGSTSSASSQSPSCGTKPAEQPKPPGKAKKNKKKNKNGDLSCVDEIFMPKSEAELDGDVDDFERELEEFKRFCFEPTDIKERRKLAVNVNLKDIFKKKSGVV